MNCDPYVVLGLPRTASAKEVQRTYRKLARKYHPDANPGDPEAEARFKEIAWAFEILGNPERRTRYDATGDVQNTKAGPPPCSDVAEVVIPILFELLSSYIQGGDWHKVEDAELIGDIKARVRNFEQNAKNEISRLTRAQDVLKRTSGRFTVDSEDDNIFESAIRGRMASVESELVKARKEQERMTRILDYLARCRYRRDLITPKSRAVKSTTMYTPNGPVAVMLPE